MAEFFSLRDELPPEIAESSDEAIPDEHVEDPEAEE